MTDTRDCFLRLDVNTKMHLLYGHCKHIKVAVELSLLTYHKHISRTSALWQLKGWTTITKATDKTCDIDHRGLQACLSKMCPGNMGLFILFNGLRLLPDCKS